MLVLIALVSNPAGAQSDSENNGSTVAAKPTEAASPQSITSALNVALVQTRLDEIEASSNLEEATKSKLVEQYRGILTDLEQIKAFDTQAEAYRAALESAPEEMASIRSEIATASEQPPSPAVTLSENGDIQKVEQLLAREQAEAAAIDAQIGELDKILDHPDEQPEAIRKRITEIKLALEALDVETPTMSIDGNSTLEQEANRWALQSHRDALRAELLMLDQEILSFDVRKELTSARRDQLRAQQKQVRARRSYLENEADRLRLVDAKQVSTETEIAQRETADAHPLIKSLVKEDLALGDQILRVTQQLSEIDEQQARLESDTLRLEEDFRSARQQLEAAGLNRILGRMLLEQRARLPELGKLRRAARIREDKIAELTLSQIRHRDELRRLGEVDNYLDDLLGQLPTDPPAGLRDELRTRVEYRRDLLRRTLSLEEDYRHALTELDLTGDRYMDTVQRYGDFLAERLLWVPSVAPITQQSFANLPAAIYWLISPLNWLGVLDVLRFEATRSPLLWLGLLAVLLLLWRGSAIRRGVRDSAEHLRRISTDRFSYTLKALGLTVLAASTWPLLLMVLGFQLANSLESDEFARAVGAGMIAVGPALYYLRSFRLLCMPGGVADRHFRWSSDVLMLLRRTFAWAASLLLPIGFVTATIYHNANPDFSGTLDRLSLVAFNLGLAVFTARLMHPRTGAVKHLLENNPQGWANRLRGLWFSVLIAVPLALALLALAGYLYTSGILVESLLSELWLVLGLLVAHQLIVRWLIVARRSLALQATLERRAQREAQRAAESQSGQDEEYKSDEILALAAAEPEIDFASLDAQTRRLLNTTIVIASAVGLWLIWSDVLPALNLFDQVTLWSYQGTVDGIEQPVPVTLADLGLILAIIAIALAAGKNLPALLEILLLKHTSFTPGSRYTMITLTGYAITAIGTIFVFSTLGLSWAEVQWLIAALSVGIGFGLQEIVANFISGLIILFERPVRVGDIVTIGDTTGIVSKIEIRATTVRNWDKQELLVPNKEFITGRLLNWTLTDQLNRVVITVGVEYGSDTRKALQLLSEVASENPRVLKDPAPLINFEGFDDNSLRLVLRCYLNSLEYRLAVTTELHQAIDDTFRAAGIVIAFPQRDVHLDASQPLDLRIHRASGATG